jgi:chemotaxis response regulator CheB
MLVNGGHITLTSTPQVRFARPSIDSTFESVAEHYAARAVGVVLTGSGSDGTRGIKAISAAGGVALVQQVDEAAYPAMPASAYATGCIDMMLPLREIAPAIVRLVTGDDAHPIARNRG